MRRPEDLVQVAERDVVALDLQDQLLTLVVLQFVDDLGRFARCLRLAVRPGSWWAHHFDLAHIVRRLVVAQSHVHRRAQDPV